MPTIRPETPDDAEAIARVHVRAWQGGYAGLIPAEVLSRLNPAAWAQRRRDMGTADPEQPFTTLVATDDAGIAGFVTFGPYRVDQNRDDLDERYGEIVSMYVDPGAWGRGLGTALMGAACTALTARGWNQLRLWVLAGNVRARRFYERAGLAVDGEQSTYEVRWTSEATPVGLPELRYRGSLDRIGSASSSAMLIQM